MKALRSLFVLSVLTLTPLIGSHVAIAGDFPFMCQTQQESEIAGFRLEPCQNCAKNYRVVLFTRVGISTNLPVDLGVSADGKYYVGVGKALGVIPGTTKNIYVAINRAQHAASYVEYQVRPIGVPADLGHNIGPAFCQTAAELGAQH